ncbi:hypothetical protein L1987_48486 [Smallanthus sonchifolius]|uniref:Uncharacterized protein n=1 Tax=Smallanthus sonchifolius TaxID=185202 RepID=A0ACB9FS52_9ASTR|nr:hypothetical protein L1987_48486 [Smallanthus sonchifolius]
MKVELFLYDVLKLVGEATEIEALRCGGGGRGGVVSATPFRPFSSSVTKSSTSMALDAANNSPPSRSYLQKTVTLLDWWLTKPQTNDDAKTLGVAGLTSQQNRAARCFSSAPILKIYDLFELETVDGVCVILQGFINKDRTLENGFSPELFDHFIIGFPPNWKEFTTNCLKIESAAKCVTGEDGKDSIEGHDYFHGKLQNRDSYTVDMGVQDCEDVMLSNKTSTPHNPSSVEIPQEHIVEAGNEVSCERPPVTPGFEDDPSLKMSPIVNSSMGSKCLGVPSRRMTRSMKKMDNSKNSFPLVSVKSNLDEGTLINPKILGSSEISRKDMNDALSNNKKAVNVVDCDMKSESRKIISKLSSGCGKGSNETTNCSEDNVLRMKSKCKQIDQNVDVVITKDVRNKLTSENGILNQGGNKDDADVSGESRIGTSISDLEEKHMKSKSSDPVSNTSVGVIDVNDDMRTNMKGCRNKKKNRDGRKLPVKRKLITSPKSAKSTSSRGKKGSEERHGSANILSLESFSGKKSRSGRVVLPPLEFWRNQKVVYDEDGQVCGVQEPK